MLRQTDRPAPPACRRALAQLRGQFAQAAGSLDAAVAAHVATCPRCGLFADTSESFRELWSALAASPVEARDATAAIVEAAALEPQATPEGRMLGARGYFYVPAQPDQVPLLHRLYDSAFGDQAPSSARMLRWLEWHPRSLFVVHPRERADVVAGSFKLLPLSAQGVHDVESMKVAGAGFVRKHLSPSRWETRAYYLGDVLAVDAEGHEVDATHPHAGGTMGCLVHACAVAARDGLPLYARPLKPRGLSLVQDHDFRQIGPADGAPPEMGAVCRLDDVGTALAALLGRRRRALSASTTPVVRTTEALAG